MESDYQSLGFKCGIEIHQQLEGQKLFCRCPAINSAKEPDIEVIRRLRAVAGELGEVDAAAKHEMEKAKQFIYVSSSEDTCLVEYDEQPPYPINQDLLNTAIEIALLLNAKIVDEMQIMRKTVVDGSNTSGFQRTALVATNGYVETEKGKVNIPLICLEEEAAQKLEETKDSTKYKLDRLGIGLIEIGTDASISSPEHAKEVASYLGMILRSTGKVKRGLGTIRQDVNVSIKGGARTEIKGFQDLRSIPKVIEYEINRQLEDIKKGKKIEPSVRKAEPDLTTSFMRPMPGANRLYPETDCSPIKITKQRIEKIKADLPQLLTEKLDEFKNKYNLKDDVAKELVHNTFFLEALKKYNKIEPSTIGQILVLVPKDIKSRLNLDITKLTDADYDNVLSYLNHGKITKEAVTEILAAKIKGEKISLDKFKGIDYNELEKEIKDLIKEKPCQSIGAYMGMIMAKHRGKIEGKKVMDMLKEHI